MLVDIAKDHGKSVAQVILRWLNQLGIVVVSKSDNKARMKENLDIFDFELTNGVMAAIACLDTGIDPIYDDQELATAKAIGTYKIHN